MTYKIDRFRFSDSTIQNFDRVGIKPQDVQFWIEDGRKNGVSDEGIQRFITDKYHELNKTEEKNRGRNVGGALRYIGQQIPLIGTRLDEMEADIRADEQGVKDWLSSLPEEEINRMRQDKDYAVQAIKNRPESFRQEAYDKLLENARESYKGAERAFKENTKKGNWVERNIGSLAPEALGLIGNVGLSGATGGATLLGAGSAAQGAIEGWGAGEDTTQKVINAGIGGLVGGLVAGGMNKLFPTNTTAKQTVNKYAKGKILGSKKPYETVIAKTVKTGADPVEVIAKESTRGTQPAIMKNLQMALKGNDAQAKVVYDAAIKNVDYEGGFLKYIRDRLPSNLSDKVKNTLSKLFDGAEQAMYNVTGEGDVLVRNDIREVVDSVINQGMKSATSAEKQAVKDAAIKAFSERGVALNIRSKLIPQKMIGNIGNQISMIRPDRILTRPVSNLMNKGTLNLLQGKSIIGKPVSNVSRSIADALIEGALK